MSSPVAESLRSSRELRIAILGAGFSGLAMAVELQRAGFSNFTLYEQADGVGGVWRANTYPGAACDVPSHLYSFSFARNPDWSRKYSSQPEILDYLERCTADFGLRPHCRFGVQISGGSFDEDQGAWTLTTTSGATIVADVVISGVGQLSRPRLPELPGRDVFQGPQFHSAQWRHDVDLRGKSVAVIGSGATAIQVVPAIAPIAGQVQLYQRTAAWIVPRRDYAYSDRMRRWFKRWPLLSRLHRAGIYWGHEIRFFAFRRPDYIAAPILRAMASAHLKRQVRDPELRRRLTPHELPGCKRVLVSDDFYPSLQMPHVELIDAPLKTLTPQGVETADGKLCLADVVIHATGFDAANLLGPLEFTGLRGTRLSDAWRDGPAAYLGMVIPDFPNLFLLYGPNTNLGHNSIVFMIECQVRYIRKCLERVRDRGLKGLSVRREAFDRFQQQTDRRMARTVWATQCRSWYKSASGRVVNNLPGFTVGYWARTRRPEFADFVELPN